MTVTAAPARFPYAEHRTLEQVDRDERVHQRVRMGLVKLPPAGPCLGCVARSVCPCPDDCPRGAEMAA